MQDKLSTYGYEFETKLIACLIQDVSFLVQIGDILKPDYFGNEGGSWVITKALEYYYKYKEAPSLVVFKSELENLESTQEMLKAQALAYLKDAALQEKATDLSYIKDQAINFCKNQEIKAAILESVDLLKASNYESIKSRLDAALKVGLNRDLGHNYKEDIEIRYTQESRDTIPTGWSVINDLTQGGLSKGELGIIVAPGGAGKSWALVHIGAAAIRAGKTVIHYTLELNEIYTSLRYDSHFTKTPSAHLPLHRDQVEKIVASLPGTLLTEYYVNKSISVLSLKGHLDRSIALGIEPDMIIVDYADLLKGPAKELRLELKEIYEDLRNLAGEYQIPVWTASQSNRSSANIDVVEGDSIAEDYSKIATGDFIMSLSRKKEDKLAGTARFHVIKNRFGPDGITFPSRFDGFIGEIELYSNTTKEAKKVVKEMKTGDNLVKNYLNEKFQNYFKESLGS